MIGQTLARWTGWLAAAMLVAHLGVSMTQADDKRAITVDDLLAFKRVSDARISPDGKWIAYVVGSVDVSANTVKTSIWLAPSDKSKPARQLTNSLKKDRSPRWSPDSKQILFESNRSGSMQLWIIDMEGGEARQLTTISTEASTPVWSADGKNIAFVSAVYPEFSTKPFAESDKLNKEKMETIERNPVKAKVFTKLFYRHWDSYVEDKRQHLFVMGFDGQKATEPRDVTPGDRDGYPTSTTFSVGDDFTFTPDGNHVVFTAVPIKNEAWNTKMELCRVPVSGLANAGEWKSAGERWETLTSEMPAACGCPRFTTDGKTLVFRAQRRAGYEADKWELWKASCDASGKLTSKPTSLTDKIDRSFDAICTVSSDRVIATAEENGGIKPFLVNLTEANQMKPGLTNGTQSLDPAADGPIGFADLSHSTDGNSFAWLQSSLTSPPVVKSVKFSSTYGANVQSFDEHNSAALAKLDLVKGESLSVPGDAGTPMQMWLIKPPGFDPAKKWPVIYLVHGGPQGAWMNSWSTRWNPAVWAAQGYVVYAPNPRGSTGFGQKYTDEISGDWGGKCYRDLMAGLDYVEKQPFVDRDRLASAGASFGGYMMNWFQGNTTKFKTLVCHCGVYNFESMYATTEEIWFDEWEHGGPPWGSARHSYEKHSPHKLAANFKTPMLIIHNDLDFRVPIGQGHELFTTLQRLGVDSKLINFPDEGHWVLKPANSKFWHEQIFSWLKEKVPPGGK